MKAGSVRRIGVRVALALLFVAAGFAASAQVVINEIAWAGTQASANDEWIELLNVTDITVDLTGWTLTIDGGVIHLGEVADATLEVRRSIIAPGGFFLLERTDDTTVSDLEADLIYTGGLSNAGEDLVLTDPDGQIVDQILAAESGWPAGLAADGSLPYATMERFHPPFNDVAWGTNASEFAMDGLDADGNLLYGTPRSVNGVTVMRTMVPYVQVMGPPEGEVFGTVVVEWLASDPDGDDAALPVSIILSREELTTADSPGVILVGDLANTGSFAWDTIEHEDGVYYLFVLVTDSDGYAATARSGALDIRNGT